jgi:Tfp pilus assembly protein PilN
MLNTLRERIAEPTRICAMEVHAESNGGFLFHWVVLSKKKQVLVLEQSGTIQGELEALRSIVPAGVPLVLSLAGKGVLHKKVEQQGGDTGKLFDYIFPNARISDYVIQTVLCEDNSFQVSVVRKDQVDKVLHGLNAMGYDVLALSFGPFTVLPLLKMLQLKLNVLQCGRHHLQIDHDTPALYQYQVSSDAPAYRLISLGTETVSEELLVAYAMGFQFLVGGEGIAVSYDVLHQQAETYKDKKMFKALSLGSLSFFFVLLVLNTIFYTLVSGEHNQLTAQYSGQQHASLSTKKNTEQFNQKESFLARAGWLDPSVMSFYADRIASSLPAAIQLTAMNACPLNEPISRKEKKEVFDQNIVVVKGMASKPTDINQWTKELGTYSWVQQVKVQDYTFDHKIGRGTFTLHIQTSGELE